MKDTIDYSAHVCCVRVLWSVFVWCLCVSVHAVCGGCMSKNGQLLEPCVVFVCMYVLTGGYKRSI